MNIANKLNEVIPNYKNILDQGKGTFMHGTHSKNQAPIGVQQLPLRMGSNAGIGVIIDQERSKSVSISLKK